MDLLEFFFLTPLPGSQDHKHLFDNGTYMDPDLNKYDLSHSVTRHSRMSAAEWERTYHQCWHTYYSDEHVETLMRRAYACGISPKRIMETATWFYTSVQTEGVHPLEAGPARRKYRKDRRPGLQDREPPGVLSPARQGVPIHPLDPGTPAVEVQPHAKGDPLGSEQPHLSGPGHHPRRRRLGHRRRYRIGSPRIQRRQAGGEGEQGPDRGRLTDRGKRWFLAFPVRAYLGSFT